MTNLDIDASEGIGTQSALGAILVNSLTVPAHVPEGDTSEAIVAIGPLLTNFTSRWRPRMAKAGVQYRLKYADLTTCNEALCSLLSMAGKA